MLQVALLLTREGSFTRSVAWDDLPFDEFRANGESELPVRGEPVEQRSRIGANGAKPIKGEQGMVDQVPEDPRPARRCFALTGGPGVGKTALLDQLGSMGFATVREAARDVIHEQLLLDSEVLPWRDQSAFQRHVLELQLERESVAEGAVVFMDRGIPDGIAYLRAYGLSVFREMLVYARERYDGVFLVEPHGEYVDDTERREDPEEAQMLHGVIEATYRDLGYELVSVPSMPVARRSEFVIERIGITNTTTEITESTELEIY